MNEYPFYGSGWSHSNPLPPKEGKQKPEERKPPWVHMLSNPVLQVGTWYMNGYMVTLNTSPLPGRMHLAIDGRTFSVNKKACEDLGSFLLTLSEQL